jgi:hypothetical protein
MLSCVLVTLGTSYAEENETAQQEPAPSVEQPAEAASGLWLQAVLDLPVLHFLAPLFEPDPRQMALTGQRDLPPCSVAPLDPITDPAAQKLEANVGSDGVIDISNMAPAASRALNRFITSVAAVGGNIVLKSAYRPISYQQHLQNVWYKWMELRHHTEPGCQALLAQVEDEFAGHHLIETQHPVAISDHTRGLAFDATVDLPAHPRLGRRRVTLDSLAYLAGLVRPVVVGDPVHYKYVGAVKYVAKTRVVRRSRSARSA